MKKEIMKIWVSRNGDWHVHVCVPNEAFDLIEKAVCTAISKTKLEEAVSSAYKACGVDNNNEQ